MAAQDATVCEAVMRADLEQLRTLIAAGADVNRPDPRGNTPLILAAVLGNAEAARLLIDAGADLNAPNGETQTALIEAAWNGRSEIVALLLEAGADVAIANHRALEFAARRGHVEIARRLIAAGADVHRRDSPDDLSLLAEAVEAGNAEMFDLLREATARDTVANVSRRASRRRGGQSQPGSDVLVTAAYRGRIELVRELLDQGLDVDTRFHGNTPLIAAAMQKHPDVVRLLLDRGANVNAQSKDKMTALLWAAEMEDERTAEMLIAAGANVELADDFGNTPLHLAVQKGRPGLIKLLRRAGASLQARDCGGWLPLRNAVWAAGPRVVRQLIDAGANPNAVDKDGVTALAQAVASQKERSALVLIERGADVNQAMTRRAFKDLPLGRGATPLMLAAHAGNLRLVEALLAAGADPTAKDARGRSALDWAARRGHTPIVARLREAGAAQPANQQQYHNAVLLRAARRGELNGLRQALESGADPNTANRYEETALSLAARNGHAVVVRELLARGADVNRSGNWYGTALRQAVIRGHSEIVGQLLDAGAEVNCRYEPCSIPAEKKHTVYPAGEHVLIDAVTYDRREIAPMLLDAGADVNWIDARGYSVLACAAAHHRWELVRLLLDRGATVDERARDYIQPLSWPEAARTDAFQQAVRDVAERCGAEPEPSRWLPGAVAFRVTASQEAQQLVESKQVPNEIVADFVALDRKVDTILDELQQSLVDRGFLLFDAGRPLGCGEGKFLALVPSGDPFAVIAAVGTYANEQELSNRDVLDRLRRLNGEQPFRLRACRFDTVGIEFLAPVPDPQTMARRMYEFCHDLVDQNFETIDRLAQHLETSRRITFWWD